MLCATADLALLGYCCCAGSNAADVAPQARGTGKSGQSPRCFAPKCGTVGGMDEPTALARTVGPCKATDEPTVYTVVYKPWNSTAWLLEGWAAHFLESRLRCSQVCSDTKCRARLVFWSLPSLRSSHSRRGKGWGNITDRSTQTNWHDLLQTMNKLLALS